MFELADYVTGSAECVWGFSELMLAKSMSIRFLHIDDVRAVSSSMVHSWFRHSGYIDAPPYTTQNVLFPSVFTLVLPLLVHLLSLLPPD